MKGFLKETYNYAILLVILFGIASIAVWQTLTYLHEHVPVENFGVVAALVWSLTLGFMLIAGSFGLWAIQFSSLAESRRRISQIVDAMDYFRDGLLVLDRKGRVMGANPSARELARTLPERGPIPLDKAFPFLSDEDRELLLQSRSPVEIERPCAAGEQSRVIRFRSQPADGVTLVLLSDITTAAAQRRHNRQAAQLQLIGQISRGVAHDFNNILCAISGHASLIGRLPPGSPDSADSLKAIAQSVERGSELAIHLLALARPATAADPHAVEHECVRLASEQLRNSLPPHWRIETRIEKIPPVSMSGLQLEQVILHMGLHAADGAAGASVMRILAGPPSADSFLFDVSNEYAGVVLISVADVVALQSQATEFTVQPVVDSGVIVSVVRSMIEGAGGALQRLVARDKPAIFRIALPRGERTEGAGSSALGTQSPDIARDLSSLVLGWSILLAHSPARHSVTEAGLRRLGLTLQRAESLPSLLSELGSGTTLHCVVVEHSLIEKESAGILRAIRRLAPQAGIVVVGADADQVQQAGTDAVAVPPNPDIQTLLIAIIESRGRSSKRQA